MLLGKVLLIKAKAVALVLGGRLVLNAVKWLPKRAVNLAIWIFAGDGLRRMVRRQRWRLRMAVQQHRSWLVIAGLALSLLVGGLLLATSSLSGVALLALLYVPAWLTTLLWQGLRSAFDWIFGHCLHRLQIQRLVPAAWRRRMYRRLLSWRIKREKADAESNGSD